MRSPFTTLFTALLWLVAFSSYASAQEQQDQAPWQTLPLTDVRSGETFTLGDFRGETVFVQPMATWCTTCRQQLGNLSEAQGQLGGVRVVALSVETTLPGADLARYADEAGFDWTFAVMTPELLSALAASFGRAVATPPSAPHFVIGPDGSVSELLTGVKSPDALVSLLRP